MVRSALALLAVVLPVASVEPATAGPVICTSTIEAPLPGSTGRGGTPISGPVEVTRCGPVQTTGELVDRRAFGWRTSFARGVSLTHQITDILGIAMGGRDGTRVMGLGFPDQAIIWDGSAIDNTYRALLEEQSPVIPWRSGDLPNLFSTSLQPASPQDFPPGQSRPTYSPVPTSSYSDSSPVRGLW